jgi:hypothetical protein
MFKRSALDKFGDFQLVEGAAGFAIHFFRFSSSLGQALAGTLLAPPPLGHLIVESIETNTET